MVKKKKCCVKKAKTEKFLCILFIILFLIILQADEDWVVFLFSKGEKQGEGSERPIGKPLPTKVQGIFKEPTTVLPFQVCLYVD